MAERTLGSRGPVTCCDSGGADSVNGAPICLSCSRACSRTLYRGRWNFCRKLMCLFVNEIGTDVVLTPVAASNVDILQCRSAEALQSRGAFHVGCTCSDRCSSICRIGVYDCNALRHVSSLHSVTLDNSDCRRDRCYDLLYGVVSLRAVRELPYIIYGVVIHVGRLLWNYYTLRRADARLDRCGVFD
ncbi:hypothetical protein H4582DRAFT_309160 [Lactarius indigo]|nr:hypothetical protein H4582DRAFT_309160 [Lactarius indigo]